MDAKSRGVGFNEEQTIGIVSEFPHRILMNCKGEKINYIVEKLDNTWNA